MAMNTRNEEEEEEEKSIEKNHHPPVKTSKKGKSCKGTLYYSSGLQSKAKNPRCIGIPRTLPHVPHSIVEESKVDASKDERHLKDFYYACAGYSVYLDQIGKEPSDDKRTATELPVCVGLEFLVGKKAHTSAPAAAPTAAHVLNKEDAREVRQPQRPKPIHSAGTDFLTRFSRNADLVASGVWKNMGKVGNYMKESVSDLLYPYRGRPNFSVYLDQIGKEPSGDKPTATELPVCLGLEFVAGTQPPAAAPTAAHALNKEDAHEVHQPRRPKPIHSAGTDFLTRFSRNPDLVASGVWKNMGKVGNYMKESVSDILYPYRGRPK